MVALLVRLVLRVLLAVDEGTGAAMAEKSMVGSSELSSMVE